MPEWGRMLTASAMESLAKAMGQRSDCESYQVVSPIKQSLKYLSEVLSLFEIPVPWNEKEAELSRVIHTYLRKYDDSPAGTIVYRLVDRGQGMQAWRAFIHALIATTKRRNLYSSCVSAMDYFAENSDEFSDTMQLAIKAWLPDRASLDIVVENCLPKEA